MAKILFLKFPKELKGEMVGLTGKSIPSLSSILELTGEAIKRLQVKIGTSANSSLDTGRISSQGVAHRPKNTFSFHIGAGPQTLPGYSRSLPPILFVTFFRGKKSVAVNCLLDTGSGRSYLSAEVLRVWGSIETIGMNCQIRLSTLLGECDQTFKEMALGIDLGCGNPVTSHVLVAESIDLSVRLTNLEPLLNAFLDAKCSLAGKFETGSDFIPIKGIIGLDLLHQLGPCQLVPCLKGWAFTTPAGVVPFGAVESFFSNDQTPHEVAHLSFNSVMTQTTKVKSSHLCFVLESQPSYLDPQAEFFTDSEVQRGLEQIFNLESLGIHDENHFSDYNQEQVRHFQNAIEFKDGKYYVELPWHADKLARVPSNHAASLRILDRVTKDLIKTNMSQDYLEVFQQQEREGIIEEIFVPIHESGNYVWIPHRPVVRCDPTATTKIRPVFNCSLKTGNGMSLNEAAYSGINLTGDVKFFDELQS